MNFNIDGTVFSVFHFNVCLWYSQLFGNSHGFGNSLEHNTVGCGCILCVYKMFTPPTKTRNDSLFGRLGTCNFLPKKLEVFAVSMLY